MPDTLDHLLDRYGCWVRQAADSSEPIRKRREIDASSKAAGNYPLVLAGLPRKVPRNAPRIVNEVYYPRVPSGFSLVSSGQIRLGRGITPKVAGSPERSLQKQVVS
jgi:hypothetical protein